MRPFLALALAMAATPAFAGWCDYQVPPPEYRQEPTITYFIAEYDPLEVERICNIPGNPKGMVGACVGPLIESSDGDHRYIYIRNDLDATESECVLLHEKAHLQPNNWNHGYGFALRILPGGVAVAPGPKWRRPAHVDPFMFVRGRVGHKPPPEPTPDWLIEQAASE